MKPARRLACCLNWPRNSPNRPELVDLISRAIVDEPPLALKEGGMIRDGFDAGAGRIARTPRAAARIGSPNCRRTKLRAPASRRSRSGSIPSSAITSRSRKANLDKVPPHYIRKQTIANGERFITPELKEMEGKILGAEERSVKLEYELFQRVREAVLGQLPEIQQTAAALAQLDVLAAFAETARLHNYCRPQVADEGRAADSRRPPSGFGTKPARGTLRAE